MTTFDRLAGFGDDSPTRWRLRPALYTPRAPVPSAEGSGPERRGLALPTTAPALPADEATSQPGRVHVSDARATPHAAVPLHAAPGRAGALASPSEPVTHDGTSARGFVTGDTSEDAPALQSGAARTAGRRAPDRAPITDAERERPTPSGAEAQRPRESPSTQATQALDPQPLVAARAAADPSPRRTEAEPSAPPTRALGAPNPSPRHPQPKPSAPPTQALGTPNPSPRHPQPKPSAQPSRALGAAVRQELVRRGEVPGDEKPGDREVHVHIDRLTVLNPTPPPASPTPGAVPRQPSALTTFLRERGQASR